MPFRRDSVPFVLGRRFSIEELHVEQNCLAVGRDRSSLSSLWSMPKISPTSGRMTEISDMHPAAPVFYRAIAMRQGLCPDAKK
jgi:hypothetical protein